MISRAPSVQRGAGITLAQTLAGNAISAPHAGQVRHPWFSSPSYLGAAKQWVATVDLGLVDQQIPIYRATIPEQKALGNPWEINPLTGQQFFSASVFAQNTETVAATTLDLPLYLLPAMPLSFRAIGFDGDASFPVPQYFLNLGAAKAPQQPTADQLQDQLLAGDTSSLDTPTPPDNLRLLRACDIWLHQPRLALTSSVELNPAGLVTGQASVIQTLGVRLPAPNDVLQVLTGTFVPTTVSTDPLSGDYEESAYDELLISTIFLLSPPKTPIGSPIDGTWQPYVRHNLFEHLSYQAAVFHAPDSDIESLTIPPLAAGAATLVISSFDSQIANAAGTAANILASASLAGTFWTATGGGHQAVMPAPVVPPPNTGLNKAASLAALAAQAAAAQRAVTLDPPFPWQGLQFDPSLLNV